MADTKITALTAIGANPIIPSTFPIPMVDLTDTSMAASGTTKKVTVNQILGAGGTATLASATITGDLTVDTSTLKVDSANNRVGVGTASPAYLLDIADASFATRFVATNTNNSAFGAGVYLKTLNGASMVSNATLATSNDGTFNLLTGTSADSTKLSIGPTGIFTFQNVGGVAGTAMTLNSTGLGVGRSPSYRLQASSGTKATTASLATVAGITTTDADDFGIYFRLKTDATGANRYASITSFDNGSGNGARDLVLQDLGGNVGIGVTPSGSGGCLQLKSGITFPATQVASSDANTLDDYEEGTWTIVVNNQLGNSATIASQIARYVKIGRRVFVFGDFTLSAKGAAAAGNLVYLGNLPFVPDSTLFEGSVVHKYDNVNLTTNGQINIISAAGGNNVCFFPISSATTGTSNLTFGQITDTTRLVFNFSYDV